MIYKWFKRRPPPLQIMSATQANSVARTKYREMFAEEVEGVADHIAQEAERGRHKIELDHEWEPALTAEIATHFRALGYDVAVGHQTIELGWQKDPK